MAAATILGVVSCAVLVVIDTATVGVMAAVDVVATVDVIAAAAAAPVGVAAVVGVATASAAADGVGVAAVVECVCGFAQLAINKLTSNSPVAITCLFIFLLTFIGLTNVVR